MSHRALLTLLALTLADVALWHWSLGGEHKALALASGLTLPPLCGALAWVGIVNLARLLARSARRPAARIRTRATLRVRDAQRPHSVASAAPGRRGARGARARGEKPEQRLAA